MRVVQMIEGALFHWFVHCVLYQLRLQLRSRNVVSLGHEEGMLFRRSKHGSEDEIRRWGPP